MSTTEMVSQHPSTVRSMLFDEGPDGERLRSTLEHSGALHAVDVALAGLSSGLVAAAGERVAGLVGRFLELDVVEVLLAGWRRYSALTEAAAASLRTPGAEEIVDLAEHRVTSTHRPRIDLKLDGVDLATIAFELDLSLELSAVRAVVTDGKLVALRSGKAELDGRLSCEEVEVVHATREVDLPGTVRLGSGVSLIPTSAISTTAPGEGYVTLP